MTDIKINDTVYHPMSVDIIEFKVISITQYDKFIHYNLKSKYNVGACGIIEVIVECNSNNVLRFVELVNAYEIEYASGLQDFIEGNYYVSINTAKKAFYNMHELSAWLSVEKCKRDLKTAEDYYAKIKSILKQIDN